MAETIFQYPIFQEFILPFLLVFTIIFAILEKTKLLGDGKKQLDAIVAFVVSLIFVTAIFPKAVVSNLILFLTISLIIVFVILLLWGFVFGEIKEGFKPVGWMKWTLGIVIAVAVMLAVMWSVGLPAGITDLFSKLDWSSPFLMNFLFIIVIAVALALVLRKKTS